MSSDVSMGDRRRSTEEERDWLVAVLQAQAALQDLYIRNGADRSWWDAALRTVLALSGGQFGFLGRIERDADGTPYLHSLAITDIAWNDWSRQVFDEFAADGLQFRNLDSLFGVTVASGAQVVSDDPATDPRRCGLPPGHPLLDSYMGIPLHEGREPIGMVGIANRPGGFEDGLADDLKPVLSVISAMIARDAAERRAAEATATAEDLDAAMRHLAVAQRERASVDAAVAAILAARSLGEASMALRAGIAALDAGLDDGVYVDDPGDPERLAGAGGTQGNIARPECLALQGGRPHVSLPGLRLDTCAHAHPMDAVTVCCPIATDEDEYGLLVVVAREMPAGNPAARASEIAGHVDRLAHAMAQVALRDALASRALRDGLTGLANRTALEQVVERRMRRIDGAARPFGVLLVDLDDFKDVNDQLGHAVGDEVLRAVARALEAGLREGDLVARLGGDEFVVILDSGDPGAMRAAGARMIEAVSAIEPAGGPGISASVGGVPLGWGDVTWSDAYEGADLLLYEAKADGKNRVVIGPLVGSAAQA